MRERERERERERIVCSVCVGERVNLYEQSPKPHQKLPVTF